MGIPGLKRLVALGIGAGVVVGKGTMRDGVAGKGNVIERGEMTMKISIVTVIVIAIKTMTVTATMILTAHGQLGMTITGTKHTKESGAATGVSLSRIATFVVTKKAAWPCWLFA